MDHGFRLLYVCTANICRSPMAAALTRRALGEIAEFVSVGSAGVNCRVGIRIADGAAMVLDNQGIPSAQHRSRVLTEELVDQADLILTMERRQRAMIASTQPAALTRTFTLREFTRVAGGGQPPPAGHLSDSARWVVEMAARRRGGMPRGPDDVPDPYRGSDEDFQACAKLLKAEIQTVLTALFDHRATGPSPDRVLAQSRSPGSGHRRAPAQVRQRDASGLLHSVHGAMRIFRVPRRGRSQ